MHNTKKILTRLLAVGLVSVAALPFASQAINHLTGGETTQIEESISTKPLLTAITHDSVSTEASLTETEAVSNEAVSNEAVSNEAVSNEAVSNDAVSNDETANDNDTTNDNDNTNDNDTANDNETTQPVNQTYAYIPDKSVYFLDVGSDLSWAFQEIDYLASRGVITGQDNYLFNPQQAIKRCDFMLMLYRAYNMNDVNLPASPQFQDVPSTAYYAAAVQKARDLGIAAGSNGNFSPTEPITRQDAMVLLQRTLSLTIEEGSSGLPSAGAGLNGYSDAGNISSYASQAVGQLVTAGVIGGNNGQLAPRENVTRAQMALMLYRALMLEQSTAGTLTYQDHPEVINLCIGNHMYCGVKVNNYVMNRAYNGLVNYVDFEKKGDLYSVNIGAQQNMRQSMVYGDNTITIDGVSYPISSNCLHVQVDPYCTINESTDKSVYPFRAATIENGQVSIIYYAKA